MHAFPKLSRRRCSIFERQRSKLIKQSQKLAVPFPSSFSVLSGLSKYVLFNRAVLAIAIVPSRLKQKVCNVVASQSFRKVSKERENDQT